MPRPRKGPEKRPKPRRVAPTRRKASPRLPKLAERRVPTQARSKERFERILDAADAIFADAGFDGATMEAIAERAGTSIGSVYQFFPNKGALFEALCARYLARSQELFEAFVEGEFLARPWPELLDAIIDAFWAFHVDKPGFRAVWAHQNISGAMLKAADVVNRAIAARAGVVMAAFAPHVPEARRATVALVAVETISALLFVAVHRGPVEGAAMVREAKVMLRAYLERVVGGHG